MSKKKKKEDIKQEDIDQILSAIEKGNSILQMKNEDNVIVIGKSGVGKSTIVNSMAGKELKVVKYGSGLRKKLVIDVPDPIPGMKVSPNPSSETTIPNPWHGEANSRTYWDCPGFGDNRGAVQDIVNAFYIERIFSLSQKVSVVIVFAQNDLEDRAKPFIDVIKSLARLFADPELLANHVSLIVTKADSDVGPNDAKEGIAEILKAQKDSLSEKELSVMKVLTEIDRVEIFHKPTKADQDLSKNIEEVNGMVSKIDFSADFEVDISVAAESQVYVKKTVELINQQMKEQFISFSSAIKGYFRFIMEKDAPVEDSVKQIANLAPIFKLLAEFRAEEDETLEDFAEKVAKLSKDSQLSSIMLNDNNSTLSSGISKVVLPKLKHLQFFEKIDKPIPGRIEEWSSKIQAVGNELVSDLDGQKGKIENILTTKVSSLLNDYVSNLEKAYSENKDLIVTTKNLEIFRELKTQLEAAQHTDKALEIVKSFELGDEMTECITEISKHVSLMSDIGVSDGFILDRLCKEIDNSYKTIQDNFTKCIKDEEKKLSAAVESYLVQVQNELIKKYSNEKGIQNLETLTKLTKAIKEVIDQQQDKELSVSKFVNMIQERVVNEFLPKNIVNEVSISSTFDVIEEYNESNTVKIALPNKEKVKDYNAKLLNCLQEIETYKQSAEMKLALDLSEKIKADIGQFILDIKKFHNSITDSKEKMQELLDIFNENIKSSEKGDLHHCIIKLSKQLEESSFSYEVNLSTLQRVQENFDAIEYYKIGQYVDSSLTQSAFWPSKATTLYHELEKQTKVSTIQDQASIHIESFARDIENYSKKKIVKKYDDINQIKENMYLLFKSLKAFDTELRGVFEVHDIDGIDGAMFIKIVKNHFGKLDGSSKLLKNIQEINGIKAKINQKMCLELLKTKDKVDMDKLWYSKVPEICEVASKRGVTNKDLGVINELDFSKKLATLGIEHSEDIQFDSVRAKQIQDCISGISIRPSLSYDKNSGIMSITGEIIYSSQFASKIDSKTKYVKVKAMNSFVINKDIVGGGVNLIILAPNWYVQGARKIDLSGEDCTYVYPTSASNGYGYKDNGDGADGHHGLSGKPGGNAGNLYGVGSKFVDMNKLTVDISGGKGGKGQDGGSGAKGKDAVTYDAPAAARTSENYTKEIIDKYQLNDNTRPDKALAGYNSYWVGAVYHNPGTKGGNCGAGGQGGSSGNIGKVEILQNGTDALVINTLNKTGVAISGKDGSAGRGGKNAPDIYEIVNPSPIYLRRYLANPTAYSTPIFAQESDGCGESGSSWAWQKGKPPQEPAEQDYDRLYDLARQTKLEFYNKFMSLKDEKTFYNKVEIPFLKAFMGGCNISGFGMDQVHEATNEDLFGYTNEFNGYYSVGMENILQLRIYDVDSIIGKTKVLHSKYLLNEKINNIDCLVDELSDTLQGNVKVIVPLNLYGKHWVGLVFEQQADGKIAVKYMDPENNPIPEILEKALIAELTSKGYEVFVEEIKVEHQLANNCGPEVIENFIWYLTGKRLPQEEVVKYHSKLVEKALLSTAESEDEEDILGISAKSKTADIVDISEFATAAVGDAVDIPVDMQLAC